MPTREEIRIEIAREMTLHASQTSEIEADVGRVDTRHAGNIGTEISSSSGNSHVARLFSPANRPISGRNVSRKTNNPVASAKLEPAGLLEPLAGAARVNSTFKAPTQQVD